MFFLCLDDKLNGASRSYYVFICALPCINKTIMIVNLVIISKKTNGDLSLKSFNFSLKVVELPQKKLP